MILIDCNTGEQVREGETWRNCNGQKKCMRIIPGWFSAEIVYLRLEQEDMGGGIEEGVPYTPKFIPLGLPEVYRIQVPIRFLHPAYLFRRVAFFPS